jgi:hypothetical protein
VTLRKRSAPGVGENTVLPTALSRMPNAITARRKVTLPVSARRRVRVVKGRHITSMRRRHHFHTPENTSYSMSLQVGLHPSIVNGRPISMEIDTGASVSIASRETFELIRERESHLELEEPTVRLQTYTGESIKVCGSTVVKVMHNGQTHSLPLVIKVGKVVDQRCSDATGSEPFDLTGELFSTLDAICRYSKFCHNMQKSSEKSWENSRERQRKSTSMATLIRDSRNLAKCLSRYPLGMPIVPVRKSDGGVRI